MRRILQSSALCLALSVVSACETESIIKTEDIPTAGVRFINAVPDTFPLDFRFVDLVESNAAFRITFRNSPITSGTGNLAVTGSTTIQYKNARAGSRQYKIFLSDTIQSVASFEVRSGTITLEAGKNYSVILWGYGDPAGLNRPTGAPPLTLTVLEEAVANPSPNVAIRIMNATRAAIDVRGYAWNPTTPPGTVPATPQTGWAAIPSLTMSPYVNFPPDTIQFNVRAAGGATGLFADVRALVGAVAIDTAPGPFDAAPGTKAAGSAITAIIYPGSVSCSRAPQATTFLFTSGSQAVLEATPTGYSRSTGSFAADGIVVGMTVGACGFTQAANNGLSTVTAVGVAPTTTATTLSATALGYARTAGSFLTNGFANGQKVYASGFAEPENNGESVITAVTALTMTVSKPSGTIAEAAATGRLIVGEGTLTVTKTSPATPTVLEGGTTGQSTVLTASTTGYGRTAGDFVADGFVAGMTIAAAGFTQSANNGTSVITAVTPTTLTVTKTPATVLEAGTTGSTTLAATATGYSRAAGSFVTDGFVVGQTIRASGFVTAQNNGLSSITAVTATDLTVLKTGGVAVEAGAAGRTVSAAGLRSIANATARQTAAERPAISWMWDRRPPRPAGT